MKIETKTTLTFKDGTTVFVDDTELRELFAVLKARFGFEMPGLDQNALKQIMSEKERKTRDDDARRFDPAVVPRQVEFTPWNQPYWVDFTHTRPLMPPYEVTCQSPQ